MKVPKYLLLFFFLSVAQISWAQKQSENIIVITTDGFRWQELFGGMDSSIAVQRHYNQGDSNYIFKKYWAKNSEDRRQKLLPFFWSTIASKGQIYGNRNFGNNVNNANPYWFSYPGYSEIFCGYADTLINSNGYKNNPNINVLEFINQQDKYKNKVAAFGAWEAFDRILNQDRSGIPVFSAFDKYGASNPTSTEKLLNDMLQDSYKPWGMGESFDVFTHYQSMDYLNSKKPKVLYIAYGETDEWAHSGEYKNYLDAARQFDDWLEKIWNYIQNDPQYKNNTSLFITTDHGRGDKNKDQWTDHGSDVDGANQIWFAVMGPNVSAKGEVKQPMQIFQKQFAQTIASLIGLKFAAPHPIAPVVTQIQERAK